MRDEDGRGELSTRHFGFSRSKVFLVSVGNINTSCRVVAQEKRFHSTLCAQRHVSHVGSAFGMLEPDALRAGAPDSNPLGVAGNPYFEVIRTDASHAKWDILGRQELG